MKRAWYLLPILILILLTSSCDALRFRPKYPATFTPLPASPTKPLTTLAATLTPSPRPTAFTPPPRQSGLTSVWIVNPYDRLLVNLDPSTGQILATVEVEGVPKSVVVGEQSIWAIESIGQETSNILRIDPFSRLIITSIPIMSGEAVSILAEGGSVWVGIAKEFGINQAPGGGVEFSRSGALLQIDPQTNQINETIDMNAIPADLLMEDQILWVLSKRRSYSYINKIDLETKVIYTIPESILSADYIHRFERFTKLGVWFWMTPQDNAAPYVFRVSSLDGIVDSSTPVGETSLDSPVDLLTHADKIWVALRNGNVVIIDPVSRRVEQTIETDASNLSDIFYLNGYIWAVSSGEALAIQISAETGEVNTPVSIGNAPPPTPTPTVTSTPNPNLIWALCEDAFETRLQVGINAVVNKNPPIPNRVRVEPSTESLILGYIQPGEQVEILAGPVCQNGWVWWNVISLETGITGWTSEGDGTNYWLLPVE